MTYQRLKSRQETSVIEPVETELTEEQVAAYLRQSTTRQTIENLESKELQLSGAQRYAVKQGLNADKIVIQWEGDGKRGVSGTKRIDQRERLRDTMQDIRDGKIKVVWAYSVSRLFRDKFGAEVGTFIETCATHGVKVVIETAKTFDFRNSFDIMLFQFLANVAARENEDRSILLHSGNNNKAKRGQYNGRPLIVGFIVDREKTSPTFGRFIPYEPHARVVRWLFRRYRELDGQFNVLAREVALMPLIFPDFEAWVDDRDVSKLQLKRVPGGYHISKIGLYHLLICVEYAGYWKHDSMVLVDEQGKPKMNHEPIVDHSDWLYAFERLSYSNLDGSDNLKRVDTRKTIVPASSRGKSRKPQTLLHGLLTSPLGTVQYSSGKYRVSEQREGKPTRSNTLTLDADTVNNLFLFRLYTRYYDMDIVTDEERAQGFYKWTPDRPNAYEKVFRELTKVQANNEKALHDVPSQIAGYEKTIAGKQATLRALGNDADVETAIMLNNDIKEARAHIAELEALTSSAGVEEAKLLKLSEQIQEFGMGKLKDMDMLRRFIRLATDSIEINEYSNHFATLTVRWSAPFAQVDVGYIYLPDGVHEAWTDKDLEDLRTMYPTAPRDELMQRFPTRSWGCLQTWAYNRGLTRQVRDRNDDRKIKDRGISLRDYEVMDMLGVNPREGCATVDLWVTLANDGLDISSGQGIRRS